MNSSVDHYENFPVASWLVPKRFRKPIAAVYWFARGADDVADEGPASTEERLQGLQQYRQALDQIAAGHTPSEPRFQALALALTEHHLLPEALTDLHHLLDAFEQDAQFKAMPNAHEVAAYCARSANPVGRLVLRIFGLHRPALLAQSDAICASLQLINFLQDVAVDAQRGRVYLPLDTLEAHGLTEAVWLEALVATPNGMNHKHQKLLAFTEVMQVEWQRAKSLMNQGRPLIHQLRVDGQWRLAMEISATVAGGERILAKIAAQGYDPFAARVKLGKLDWIKIAARAFS